MVKAMEANSSKIASLQLKFNQTQEKQLLDQPISASGGTKGIQKNTGDTMIDATLKAIGEKAPPLPAHILSEMHSQANGEKKQQVKYEQSPAPQITEQKPSMPFGISATPSTPPTEQIP